MAPGTCSARWRRPRRFSHGTEVAESERPACARGLRAPLAHVILGSLDAASPEHATLPVRTQGAEERRVILAAIDEAIPAGPRGERACQEFGLRARGRPLANRAAARTARCSPGKWDSRWEAGSLAGDMIELAEVEKDEEATHGAEHSRARSRRHGQRTRRTLASAPGTPRTRPAGLSRTSGGSRRRRSWGRWT